MAEFSRERAKLEDDARTWADAPASDNKRDLAAPLILRMIAAMRNDLRQDLAKDQLDKAIKAMWRGDQAGASQHVRIALTGAARAPVAIEWDELAARADALNRGHPDDDPGGDD